MDVNKRRSILLIENDATDFYKARLPLALFLIERKWQVTALIPQGEKVSLIEKAGINTLTYSLDRRNKGILQLVKLVSFYKKLLDGHSFDYIHSFRFQPNFISVLVNFFNKKKLILHVTGLGIVFSNESFKYKLLRFASQIIYQIKLIRVNKIIFQNPDDVTTIWFHQFWKRKIEVIYGSGVNTEFYKLQQFDKKLIRLRFGASTSDTIFLCVSRLIWEKGIREMVGAFEKLKQKGYPYKLWIVGSPDTDNPRSLDSAFINRYDNNDTILFLGRHDNVRELLAGADVFLYPSYYREGIPRSILEALSMALPIITSDMPGCNLTVKNGVNGYMIPPRSEEAIYDTVVRITKDDSLAVMGESSRLMAENLFSNSVVFHQIENNYKP